MKLTELIKKESVRTSSTIPQPDLATAKPRKTFKRERIWLGTEGPESSSQPKSIQDSRQPASPVREKSPLPNAPESAKAPVDEHVTSTLAIPEFTSLNKSLSNTDKIPTTDLVEPTNQYRQNTDNNNHEKENGTSLNTDKIPTRFLGQFDNKSENESENTDKIPTTDLLKPTNQYRQNTDNNNHENNNDILPNTDKIPTKYRQRNNNTDKIPAKYRQQADKIPTIVPTTRTNQYRQNTDNELAKTPNEFEAIIKKLSGGQLRLMEYCFRSCIVSGKDTFSITYSALAKAISVPEGSIRTTAKILKTRALIGIQVKKGPGGFISIKIEESVFRILARLFGQELFNTDKIPTKQTSEYRQNTDKMPSSKLVSNINTNLTRQTELKGNGPEPAEVYYQFSADWGSLEAHVAKLSPFGVTATQIGHLRNQKVKLYGYEIIDLIDRLEVYLRDPKTAQSISNKPGFFVSECRKKAADPNRTCFLDTVELPHEKAQRELAKTFIEEKRRLESAVAEIAVREESSELESMVESKGGWDAVLDLVPNGMVPKGSGAHRALVRQYFRDLKRGENGSHQ